MNRPILRLLPDPTAVPSLAACDGDAPAPAAAQVRCDALLHQEWTADPRPDLAEDAAAWTALLSRVYDREGPADPILGALYLARCLGARLTQTGRGRRLIPGAMDADSYALLREAVLLPHAATLLGAIQEVLDRRARTSGRQGS